MKKILAIGFILASITFASCKKSETKPEPTPAPTPTPTVTYSNFSIDVLAIDVVPSPTASTSFTSMYSGTLTASNLKILVRCNNVTVDSLVNVPVNVYSNASGTPGFCNNSSFTVTPHSFKFKDGSDNSVELYSNGVKIASSILDRTGSPYLNSQTGLPAQNFSAQGTCSMLFAVAY